MLLDLQKEYLVPAKKVSFYYMREGVPQERRTLELPPFWRDPRRLEEAMRGFNALR